jgi:HD-like signal output (HDOD) protein
MNPDVRRTAVRTYIGKMPSLSTTVTKVMEICNNPNASPADLNRIISLDPVLMGKVMRLINSAYYGLSQEVTSLARAVIMLGLNTVKNLALSTAVLGSLNESRNFQSLNMEGFWRHSLAVGVASKLLAKRRKVDPKFLEEYFIAGVLHDIGKIPLNSQFSADYLAAMSAADSGSTPLFVCELEALGMGHAECGGLIAEYWKLSEEIKDVIVFHHSVETYDGRFPQLLHIVAIANYWTNVSEIGFSGDRYPEKALPESFQATGATMDDLDAMEESVLAEIEKASIFLKLGQRG